MLPLSDSVMWLIAGLVLAGAEIFVGTFYLLVMGIACLLSAACAWMGLSTEWQFSVFAVALLVGGVAVKSLRKSTENPDADHLQNPDVGQMVTVEEWNADGTALVTYRGAQWMATAQAGEERKPGLYLIVEVAGARLVVKSAQ